MTPGPATAAARAGTGGAPARYGGFLLGVMQLALPMQSLREVVPLEALVPLPSPAPCVRGGIRLRGVTVPVLDLRCVLGLAPAVEPPACPSVIVMVHDGRILGLLADGVAGVFSVRPGGQHRMHAADPLAAVLAGSLEREDDGAPVSLLSAAALAALPQVPMVEDPEPARQRPVDETADLTPEERGQPMMLMHCAGLPLAIDAMAVHATVSDPRLEPSVLAMGHCRGVIEFAGLRIPALDLVAVCGLGSTAGQAGLQAFVVRLPAGLVALLVSEVQDVVRVQAQHTVPVPAFALPRPALIDGALPLEALPPDLAARHDRPLRQYLVVNVAGLLACEELQGAAGANTPAVLPGASPAAAPVAGAGSGPADGIAAMLQDLPGRQAAATAAGSLRSLLTYGLGAETASPIEQVAEILPYEPQAMLYRGNGQVLGMVVSRGRAIPVLCLSQTVGGPPVSASPSAAVLVVATDGAPVGFAVPRLTAIEATDWAGPADDDADRVGPCDTRRLARVGSGSAERLLPVLDLQALARQVQGRALPA